MGIQQIFFLILLILVIYQGSKSYGRLIRNIRLGKDYEVGDQDGARWKQMLLVAFGQKKMFKRPIPALLHACIYVAFLFTQIELIEIIIDGVFGVHRFFAAGLGGLYTVIISSIEVLSVLALIATIAFLWRRNVKKVARFEKPEMTGWPKWDANLILIGELLLLAGVFTMNMSDTVLQQLDPSHYTDTGTFLLSGSIAPALMQDWDVNILRLLERIGWWLHILVVFAFLLYLPISKHLHIIFAFPNTYFGRLQSKGQMSNMPAVMTEVQSMLGLTEDTGGAMEDIPEFGAKDVFDLSWKQLMDAYTCTECGRCTDSCPANITGKTLSPRKIMMDVRDRLDEVGKALEANTIEFVDETATEKDKLTPENYNDGKSLFDRISKEELHACTTCNACVEACPVLINPMEIILDMRRYEILTEGGGPSDWVPMFTSLENSGAVWQLSEDRDAWTKDT